MVFNILLTVLFTLNELFILLIHTEAINCFKSSKVICKYAEKENFKLNSMKKVVALLSVMFLTLGACSSDDNKGSDTTGIEVGISHSTTIKTPKWLHGTWMYKGFEESENWKPGYRISQDDVCMLVGTTYCYKGMIKELLRVSKDAVNVTQEYDEDYYYLHIDIAGGASVELEFNRVDDSRVDFVQNGTRTQLLRR